MKYENPNTIPMIYLAYNNFRIISYQVFIKAHVCF